MPHPKKTVLTPFLTALYLASAGCGPAGSPADPPSDIPEGTPSDYTTENPVAGAVGDAADQSTPTALLGGTLNAAMVAGQSDRVGSIEPGKQAEILMLDADPLSDIGNLQAMDRVIKSGVMFDRAMLLPPAG